MIPKLSQKELFQQQIKKLTARLSPLPTAEKPAPPQKQYTRNGTCQCPPAPPPSASPALPRKKAPPLFKWLVYSLLILFFLGLISYFVK